MASSATHSTSIGSDADASAASRRRVGLFDALRGFSVISMVLFHLCYDLRFIYRVELAFFHPPFMDIWRASISWTFLFVAGCMCVLSRDNLKRALRYLGVALAVFVATSLIAVDDPISFGIIFCMGACTLTYHLLDLLGLKPRGVFAAAVLLIVFLLLLGLPSGHIGLGQAAVTLPRELYRSNLFAFAGFHNQHFVSGDYYPLIPYVFMYLCGAAMGNHWRSTGFPAWMYGVHLPPLEAVGQLALPIYVLHQPLLLAVLQLVYGR